ncbi:MAG: FtsW/RodA/SpoVE family cell cycle protein [Bacteroidota bacterium]
MSIGNRIYAELRGDRVIWMIVIVLAVISILTVYSATGTFVYKGGSTEFFLMKQLIMVTGGLVLTYFCYLMHYMNYSKYAPMLLIACIPLLVYTIAFAAEVNEARRWIQLPIIGITFQTSDLAKLALIIYVARAISSKQEYIKDFESAFLPIIVPILIICGLIAPADLSTALLLFVTCMLMMFMGRVDLKYIGLLVFLWIVVFAFLIVLGKMFEGVDGADGIFRVNTWINRLAEFANNPDGGYQIQQAKIAIANGEWFGAGPGKSMMRAYLPSPYSDFIYATIIEEYGLLGGFVVTGLYVLLFVRTVKIVTNSPKAFGAMLALGLSLILVIQAFANMAVAVNLVPVTGLTLPMVSMGGTSTIFTCISFGIILSVSKYIEKAK